MSSQEICPSIFVSKTDESANICAGQYDFDPVAREWIHTVQSSCRIGKYLDFDSGIYKWRGYHWTDISQPQPANTTRKAQFSIPPMLVAYTESYTRQNLSNYIGDGEMGRPTDDSGHLAHYHDENNPGCDYSYYPASSNDGGSMGTPYSEQSIVYMESTIDGEDDKSRASIKFAKENSQYWGNVPGETPQWAIEHYWRYDDPSKPTEPTGEGWTQTNTSGIGHYKGTVLNVYVLDENMGATSIVGGSYIPYRKATSNDGKIGDTFFSNWVGGVEWEYNSTNRRADIANEDNPNVPQNFPFFHADGVDGYVGMNGVFFGSTQSSNGADAFGKNFLSNDICTLLNNYYYAEGGGVNVSTNYNDFINYKDHISGFERMWIGAGFNLFGDGKPINGDTQLEVKVVTDDPNFITWIDSGNHGRCADSGWLEPTGIEADSNIHDLCPTDGDWSGTGIEISIPDSSGGGGGGGGGDGGEASAPATGPTDTGAQQPGGGSGGASDPTVGPTDLDAVQGGGGGTGGSGGGSGSGEGPPTFTGNTISSKYLGYCIDERTSALSGPFDHESITAVATKDNSAEMYAVTEDLSIKKTDLLEFNEAVFPKVSDPFGDITQAFDTTTEKGVVCSKTGEGFLYRGRYLSAPFEEPVDGPGTVKEPLFFKDSYLAIAETNWLHLGDEHNEKQFYRCDLSFRRNSTGYLWLFVKGEEEKVKGQYKGPIKEHMKVFTNLRGRSFRIQMIIATHNDHPWALREMAVGHLYGKSF